MADKDLLISNFLTNYNHKELRTLISEQNEPAGGRRPLQVSLEAGAAANVQLRLRFSQSIKIHHEMQTHTMDPTRCCSQPWGMEKPCPVFSPLISDGVN